METKTELRQKNLSELNSIRVCKINDFISDANHLTDDVYEALMDFDSKTVITTCKKHKELLEKILNFSNNSNKEDIL